ncbi:MAG: WecB/TagA/CpsF family glycosyltransferase [Planctomycetota bacterium]
MVDIEAHKRPSETTEPAIIEIGRAPIRVVSESGCIDWILRELDAGRGGWVVTANVDILRQWSREAEIRSLISEAYLVADGMPLVWASRILGSTLPERVCGSNLIFSLSAALAKRQRSIFLMGGDAGTAEETASILRDRYPGLQIAGFHPLPAGFDQDSSLKINLRATLAAVRPDVVYVALGFPKQERVIAEFRRALPEAWWLGVGISFSFVSGEVPRAPMWMQKIGVEWLHRLAKEPGRLASRYLVHDLPFTAKLLFSCVVARFGTWFSYLKGSKPK